MRLCHLGFARLECGRALKIVSSVVGVMGLSKSEKRSAWREREGNICAIDFFSLRYGATILTSGNILCYHGSASAENEKPTTCTSDVARGLTSETLIRYNIYRSHLYCMLHANLSTVSEQLPKT